MTWTIGYGIAACGAFGLAVALAIRGRRLRRELAVMRTDWTTLYRRELETREALASLEEQVTEFGPALIDGRDRWGFPLSERVRTLIGPRSSWEVSYWLLSHAPGISALGDGHRLVVRERIFPEFTGWRPPRLPEGQ